MFPSFTMSPLEVSWHASGALTSQGLASHQPQHSIAFLLLSELACPAACCADSVAAPQASLADNVVGIAILQLLAMYAAQCTNDVGNIQTPARLCPVLPMQPITCSSTGIRVAPQDDMMPV